MGSYTQKCSTSYDRQCSTSYEQVSNSVPRATRLVMKLTTRPNVPLRMKSSVPQAMRHLTRNLALLIMKRCAGLFPHMATIRDLQVVTAIRKYARMFPDSPVKTFQSKTQSRTVSQCLERTVRRWQSRSQSRNVSLCPGRAVSLFQGSHVTLFL